MQHDCTCRQVCKHVHVCKNAKLTLGGTTHWYTSWLTETHAIHTSWPACLKFHQDESQFALSTAFTFNSLQLCSCTFLALYSVAGLKCVWFFLKFGGTKTSCLIWNHVWTRIPGLTIRYYAMYCNGSVHMFAMQYVWQQIKYLSVCIWFQKWAHLDPKPSVPIHAQPLPFTVQLFLDFCAKNFRNGPGTLFWTLDSFQSRNHLKTKSANTNRFFNCLRFGSDF